MYTDSDIESAVAAGVLSADSADAFRAHVQSARATPQVDEENFKLLTGFNDIFVALAGLLFFLGISFAGGFGSDEAPGAAFWSVASPILIGATAWGFAEFFTRKRRMALPSILFAIAFVGSAYSLVEHLIYLFLKPVRPLFTNVGDFSLAAQAQWQASYNQYEHAWHHAFAIASIGGTLVAIGAAYLHWRHFHVPITMAVGAAAAAGLFLALLVTIFPWLGEHFQPFLLAPGLVVFAAAMWWDMSDTARKTHRSDVAFWLHMLASPLIVHSIFSILGVFNNDPSPALAFVVLSIYVLFAIVALIIDRRAMLVSSLIYVGIAIAALFKVFGGIDSALAVTILILGGTLLLLSALWQRLRAPLVGLLPLRYRTAVPPVALPA